MRDRTIALYPGESITLADGTTVVCVPEEECRDDVPAAEVGNIGGNSLRSIRERLGLTQDALGKVMDCVQGNITAYEREVNPRPIPHRRAAMLIEYAKGAGVPLSFDHVYGSADLPAAPEPAHA